MNVSDVVYLVNVCLNRIKDYNSELCDVNNDALVNVSDIVYVVNICLKMKKYEKPVMVTVDINVDESMLVGSIGYTSDEANKDYEVLSKERENDSEWGHLW